MNTDQLVITLLVVVPPLVVVAFYYARYRTSPAGRWKQAVLGHIRALQARQAALREDSSGFKRTAARLAEEAFGRYLQTVSVDRLADFPNIGPVTIERLREEGYRRLADVARS